MTRRSAVPLLVALALSPLAGCAGSKSPHTPADVRGEAIRPVEKAPPEGALSGAPEAKPFTLRRPALQRDTVVRVDPPPRAVTMPDSATPIPTRTVTMSQAPAAPVATGSSPAPATATPGTPAGSSSQPARASSSPAAPPARDTTAGSTKSGQFLMQEPPQVLTRVPAVYPERARQARVGGTVLVKVLVGSDGLVRATRVVRSISELDSAAVACVKQWKFKPAMSSGVAVAAWTDVPVRFLLQ